MICLDCVKNIFQNRDYLYFITIKPPPEEDRHQQIYLIVEYLRKKNLVFWIVKCQSVNKYIHFHGILSFNETQTPHKGLIACIQRYVNRHMGYLTLTPLFGTKDAIYNYIRDNRNTNAGEYEQTDYHSAYVPDHRCLI